MNLWRLLLIAFRSAYDQRHPHRARAYLEATAGVAAFWLVLAVLQSAAGAALPSSPYLLVVLVLALRWGLRIGFFAALLSTLAEQFAWLAPGGAPVSTPHALANLAMYVTVALSIGLLASFYRGERLRAERAANQEREAAEYQRRMVAILAHDLKAPLTAVRGYMELARRQTRQEQPRRADAALAMSLEQLERITAMITNLVEASRIEQEALTLEALLVAPALERATHALASDPAHPVALSLETGEPLVARADPLAFGRILDNLLSNAVKYSPQGGAVLVEAVRLAAPGGSARVRIRVIDHGVGVPEEEREKIFAPYYRGSNQRFASGTGVGLYICRELAQKMGGTLSYAPNPEGGSCFQLDLATAKLPDTLEPSPAAGDAAPAAFSLAGASQPRD